MRGFSDLLAFLILYTIFLVGVEDCADIRKADNRRIDKESLKLKKAFDDCSAKHGEDYDGYIDCLRERKVF